MSFWTGDDGRKADPANQNWMNEANQSRQAYQNAFTRNNAGKSIMADYQSGKISLADALKGLSGAASAPTQRLQQGSDGTWYDTPDNELRSQNQGASYQGLLDALGSNGITGSKVASDIVRSDPMSSGLFGEGGIQDQSQAQYGKLNGYMDEDRQALMGRDQSYGLTDQDLKAYGQASDSLGRQYASSDQSLAQMLADRGLSQAPSGAAMQAFSGQFGNKNEQLSQMQLQLSQNRINTAQQLAQARTTADAQRAAQNNTLMTQLGSLGQTAVDNQYKRQLAGAENNANTSSQNAATQDQGVGLQQNINNAAFGQQQSTKSGGFLGGLGDAVGAGAMDALTGGASSAVSGGLGAAGGGLSSLFSSGGTPGVQTSQNIGGKLAPQMNSGVNI